MAVNSRIHFECLTTNDCHTIRNSIFYLGAEFSSVTVQPWTKFLFQGEQFYHILREIGTSHEYSISYEIR